MILQVCLLAMTIRGPVQQYPLWVGIVFIGVLVAAGIYASMQSGRKTKYWEKGLFPPGFRYTRDHLMEAYIAIGALMVHRDRVEMVGKLGYINAYLRRHFSDVYYNFKDSYRDSLRHPVQVHSLAAWFRKHVKSEEERLSVVEFAVGLAFYDGFLNAPEQETLRKLTEQLGLDSGKLTALLERYTVNQQDKRNRNTYQSTGSSSGSKAAAYAEVLGVASNCTLAELKKAYRGLVMIYHPDKFRSESLQAQQKAAATFLEVQEAYEYLERQLSAVKNS